METTLSEAIRDLADKYLAPYHIRNGQIIAKVCPFCGGGESCDENTFAVGLYNGAFNCMRSHCNKSGNFRQLCDYFGQKAPETVNIPRAIGRKKMYARPNPEDLKPLTQEIIDYMNLRGISKATLEEFGISSDVNGNIVFPFYREGKLIYVKYREPRKYPKQAKKPKEWQLPDTEPILFGMDKVSFNRPLIITEGEIDALALYEAGVPNAVSVPCGCNQFSWVDSCWDYLEKFQQIILFGDMDEPGMQMMNTLLGRLGEDRCMLPPDYPMLEELGRVCKDANEILKFHGPEVLKELVSQCEPAPVNGILDLADVPFVDPSTLPRIYTTIPALDHAIGGLSEGGLTIFTGKRGDGKSTLIGQIALNAIDQGYKVCTFSGELSSYKFLEWTFLQATESKFIGTTMDPRSGKLYPSITPFVQRRIKDWFKGNYYLFDNNFIPEKMTRQQAVLNVFKICARRYGCKLFVVDNLLVALNATAQEENRVQADFAAALKSFAVKNKVHVILVAHPRKTKVGEALQNDDVAGSSALTNLADNVISIEKPNIRITKNRDFGICDLIECGYNPINRRIYQASIGDKKVYKWDHTGVMIPERPASSFEEFAA